MNNTMLLFILPKQFVSIFSDKLFKFVSKYVIKYFLSNKISFKCL